MKKNNIIKLLKKKAVSMPELLTVIVITGIIAAIAVPAVGNVIESTKAKAVFSDAAALKDASTTYCTLNTDDEACQEGGTNLLAKITEYVSKDFDGKAYIKTDGKMHFAIAVTDGKYLYLGDPQSQDFKGQVAGTALDTSAVANLVPNLYKGDETVITAIAALEENEGPSYDQMIA